MSNVAVHEAVLFFGKQGVAREMLYPEFESLLDGMIPAPELANTHHQAVYVTITGSLAIRGLVFFTLSFDKHGFADSKWNLPLRSLASKGVEGPDLGAGPVRIFMLGMAEDSDYAKYLWDPTERGGKNDLIHVRNAIRENRLLLEGEADEGWMGDAAMVMREEAPVPSPQKAAPAALKPSAKMPDMDNIPTASPPSTMMDADNDEFSQAIKIIESQRIRIGALENALKKASQGPDLGSELEEAREQMEALQAQVKELTASVAEQKKEAGQWQKKSAELEKKLQRAEKSLQQLEDSSRKTQETMEKSFAKELKQNQENLRKELEETANKERESLQADFDKQIQAEKEAQKKLEQQIESFKKELTELRGDRFRLLKNGAENFFQNLAEADLSFMTFRPGVGHITIPLEDIGTYMNEPNAYCAKKCNVTTEDYEIWLEHYKNPVCTAPLPGDKICGDKVTRIDIPSSYQKNVTNRCKKHGGK